MKYTLLALLLLPTGCHYGYDPVKLQAFIDVCEVLGGAAVNKLPDDLACVVDVLGNRAPVAVPDSPRMPKDASELNPKGKYDL